MQHLITDAKNLQKTLNPHSVENRALMHMQAFLMPADMQKCLETTLFVWICSLIKYFSSSRVLSNAQFGINYSKTKKKTLNLLVKQKESKC